MNSDSGGFHCEVVRLNAKLCVCVAVSDRAFSSVYSGVGFSIGVVASVILFKRAFLIGPPWQPVTIVGLTTYHNTGRAWPIALGAGFGAGAAYADCDRSFNPARIPGVRIVPASSSTQESK